MSTPGWTVEPEDPGAAPFALALGLHPLTAALLRRRGLASEEAVHRFLHPTLDDLSDPGELPGMDEAVASVARALEAGRRIAIHGDYDVDGISATAILLRGLRALGADPLWYLPHRFHDGYGLGVRAVETLAARGADLLITADCGITAVDSVGRARALGCDVVILDHHVPSDERPAAVVVEPSRDPGAPAPPSAAGLAFAFMLALRRRLGARPAIQAGLASLAALGTIADVVPLLDDNRRLAAAGLAEMRVAPLAGIRALAAVAGIEAPIDARTVGWQLGPRLNAPGRLGDPAPSLELLITDDEQAARALAERLDAANRERQSILARVLGEALVQAEEDAQAPALVVAGEGWHPGVVGLVAGRLVEQYRRPVVAIGVEGEAGRGSARSVEAFDLVGALGACGEHLLAFGGHAMAAGLSIAREAVPEFRRAFQELAREGAAERSASPRLCVDAEVRLDDITPRLIDELERLGPFGAANPEPMLAARGVHAVNRRVVGDGQHLRMDVTDGTTVVEAIGFTLAPAGELLLFTEAPLDLAFVPERDRLDRERIRLRVQALEIPGMDPESVLADTGALLDRLFRRAADYLDETPHREVEDAPTLYTKVVGVTFDGRQDAVAALHPGDRLRLVREPANAHDPHAVRVVGPDGRDLGYLRAQLAGRLSPSIDVGARYHATVMAVTGGGDRTLGVNVFLERDDAGSLAVDGAPGRAGGNARPRSSLRAAGDRLPIEWNDGRPWPAATAAAFRAMAGGRSVVLGLPPGCGWAGALAGAAALNLRDGACVLLVAPLRRQVYHRTDQVRSRLARLGVRVLPVHGLQGLRERERVVAALRAGEVDVLVASAEVVAEDWVMMHADRISAVLVDAGFGPCRIPHLADRPVCVVAAPAAASVLERLCPGAEVVCDAAPRTGLRVVDRRGAPDKDAALEEVIARDEKIVVYAAGRDECVQLAQHLRAPGDARTRRVGYLHGGLPARVRQIVAQAFREGRLDVLVATAALDEETLPPDVRDVLIASLPSDRARFVEEFGGAGFGARPVTVIPLFGADEMAARRRALAGRAPDRQVLAAIYRELRRWRGDAAWVWPDDATWAHLSGAMPDLPRSAVDGAMAIFEEAGLATREVVLGRSEVQLLPALKRDLGTSLRYREGRRERDAFEEFAQWALRASGFELLQAAAGQGGDS